MSEIFSEQLTAIANIVLAVFAIVTAWYASRAFVAQRREVRAVERQVSDQEEVTRQQAELLRVQADQLALQQRQFDEDQAVRKRAQAAQVFITNMSTANHSPDGNVVLKARVQNTSKQPIYDISARWRTDDGAFGTPNVMPLLMPGDGDSWAETWSRPDGISALTALVDFREASGAHWRITDRGILTELCGETSPGLKRDRRTHPPAHGGPHSWE